MKLDMFVFCISLYRPDESRGLNLHAFTRPSRAYGFNILPDNGLYSFHLSQSFSVNDRDDIFIRSDTIRAELFC